MKYVCAECGYNAGENGEKILQLHMSMAHGKSPLPEMTPQQLALLQRENEAVIARASLIIGGIASLIGLGLAAYGGSNFAILSCRATTCFIPQTLVDQITASSFASVFIGAQATTFAGLLLFTIGFMGVVYWVAQRLDFAARIQLVFLIGIFILILVTSLAIAGGNNSFWTTHNPSKWLTCDCRVLHVGNIFPIETEVNRLAIMTVRGHVR